MLLRQRQVGNFRDGVVVAQPTSDARFLALRALLAKVTMPTAARSNCDLAAEVARHGVDVIVSLLSGTESPVDRFNALPHAAKVASPRSRLWFLGRNVRGLSEVGAPSPPPAENRNGRRAPPTPVRLEDGPNLAPEAESFSPRHSEEDGPATRTDDDNPPPPPPPTPPPPPEPPPPTAPTPWAELIQAMQTDVDAAEAKDDDGDWEDDQGEGIDAQFRSLSLLPASQRDAAHKRRLMVALAHSQYLIVFRAPTKVCSCVLAPERDLRTCASPDPIFWVGRGGWGALITERAPLEKRCR